MNIDHVVNVWPDMEVVGNQGQTMYDYDVGERTTYEFASNGICPLMFYELHIHSNGAVSPCAVDYNYKNENLGNVKTQSLKEIWNSYKLLQIRRQALKGEKVSYEICRNCTYALCAATVNLLPYREKLLKKYNKEGRA